MVLDTFISTFIYSIIVLLTIKEADDDAFIPKISIAFGFLLSICSLGVLIFFIHHIASSIEAEHFIKSSYDDLRKAGNPFMLDAEVQVDSQKIIISAIEKRGCKKCPLECQTSGYLQLINHKQMCHWANKEGVIIHLFTNPVILLMFMSECWDILYYRTAR